MARVCLPFGRDHAGGFVLHRCIAFALATAAVPASAGGIDNVRSLDVAVSGTVREHCAIGGIPDRDFGDLRRPGLGFETHVAFDCNIPFTMTIRGAQGALAHSTMPGGQGPYSGTLPYSLEVEMALRHPARSLLRRAFDSRQLQAGGAISSNGGIATDGMRLTVELGSPPGNAGLLAGDYTETITIVVTPV